MKIFTKLLLIVTLVTIASTLSAQNTVAKTIKTNGVTMIETLNEDGTELIQRPYRWFAGMAEADVESVAVEMAQLEAYAAVSRVIENAVSTNAERSTLSVDGKVAKALKSHWEQMSFSIQKACEPFGEAEVTYNDKTGLYEVIAKVGIRGDRYVKLLDGAKKVKPEGLNKEELQEFIEVNDAIIDSAKGN